MVGGAIVQILGLNVEVKQKGAHKLTEYTLTKQKESFVGIHLVTNVNQKIAVQRQKEVIVEDIREC